MLGLVKSAEKHSGSSHSMTDSTTAISFSSATDSTSAASSRSSNCRARPVAHPAVAHPAVAHPPLPPHLISNLRQGPLMQLGPIPPMQGAGAGFGVEQGVIPINSMQPPRTMASPHDHGGGPIAPLDSLAALVQQGPVAMPPLSVGGLPPWPAAL